MLEPGYANHYLGLYLRHTAPLYNMAILYCFTTSLRCPLGFSCTHSFEMVFPPVFHYHPYPLNLCFPLFHQVMLICLVTQCCIPLALGHTLPHQDMLSLCPLLCAIAMPHLLSIQLLLHLLFSSTKFSP